jgi:flagellar biosynthesis protein FlhF
MNVRKFIAATARDALHKVKETLGPDAIILSNRGIPGGVEIMAVAALDMAMIVPTPGREAPLHTNDYTVSLSAPARQAASSAPAGRATAPAKRVSCGACAAALVAASGAADRPAACAGRPAKGRG